MNILSFLKSIYYNLESQQQTLERRPEPESITTSAVSVSEYSQVEYTSMMILYGQALDFLDRLPLNYSEANVLEICCGPGVFTKLISTTFSPKSITSVDLSPSMLEVAKQNCKNHRNINFVLADMTKIVESLESRKFDLIILMNGLHQLPTLELMQVAVNQIPSLLNERGFVLIMDPIRPKSELALKNLFDFGISFYLRKNLFDFQQQYKDSLYASTTLKETKFILKGAKGFHWGLFYGRLLKANYFTIGTRKKDPPPIRLGFFPRQKAIKPLLLIFKIILTILRLDLKQEKL